MRLSTAQARQRFLNARVARFASVAESGAPHLVPVTFAVIKAELGDEDLIVSAIDHKPKSTTALRRLDNIAVHPQVTFLVDEYDDNWDRLWWSRADAVAEIIDGAVRTRAIAALRAKYPQYERTPPSGVVIGSRVLGWSGWQAAPPP